MLQLFRKNMVFNNLLLIPYILIVHSGKFFVNYGQIHLDHSWLTDQLILWSGLTDNAQFYVSLIILFVDALLLNQFVNDHKLNPDGQLFAGLVLIILSGFHPVLSGLTGLLIGSMFYILALRAVSNTYLMKNASLSIFNFGFYSGLATLFYTTYLWLVVLGIFGLIVFRGLSFRELMQLISGLVCVAILLAMFLYVKQLSAIYFADQYASLFSPYPLAMKFGGSGLVSFVIVMILFIAALLQFSVFQIKTHIGAQKVYDFLFWACLISLFSVMFVKIDNIAPLLILIMPLSVLLAVILAKIRNLLLAETLHLFFAILALFLQLQNW
ncbi:MAG: hypothetical protein U0V49_06715 [Saprospiraceae bacterium]